MADSLHVDLTGSASGFVSAVDAATHSLGSLQKRVESMGFVSRTLKELVTPATTAIASAFAASKALGAFAESNLPGAKKYSDAVEKARTAVTGLAAAVGEYLAPQAIKLANFITSVAEKLTPWVRKFTAFTESAGAFLAKLGSNAADAFRAIMPALDGIINYISGLFKGPAHDWMADVEVFRNWWNDTWDSILNYTAPLIVAAASAIDQALSTIGEMATAAFNAARAAIEPFLEGMQGGEVMVGGLAEAIQVGLVNAFGAAEFAMKNWRETAELAWAAIKTGVSIVGDVMQTALTNAITALKFFSDQAKSLFAAIFGEGGYIVKLLNELFTKYLPTLLQTSTLAMRNRLVAAMPGGQAIAGANPNAPFAPVGFNNPAFNWKPGAFPEMQGFAQGDRTTGLKAILSGLAGTFGAGLGDFLDNARKRAVGEGFNFIDAIKNGLPNVNAIPAVAAAGPNPWMPPDNRAGGLFLQGSQEAYKEIQRLKNDPNGTEKSHKKIAEDHLAVAKDTKKLLQDNLAKPARGGLRAGGIP